MPRSSPAEWHFIPRSGVDRGVRHRTGPFPDNRRFGSSIKCPDPGQIQAYNTARGPFPGKRRLSGTKVRTLRKIGVDRERQSERKEGSDSTGGAEAPERKKRKPHLKGPTPQRGEREEKW